VWGRVLAQGYDTWSAPAVAGGTLFQSIEEGCTGDSGNGPHTSILTARSLATRQVLWHRMYENVPPGRSAVGREATQPRLEPATQPKRSSDSRPYN
jgi:hypothetical protein